YELGQDLLLNLLKPRTQPDKFERLEAHGADRHLALAAPDKNEEDKGYSGYSRSRQLFTQTVSYQGENSRPSLFMGRVADFNGRVKDGDRAVIIDTVARSGGAKGSKSASGRGWSAIYPDIGDDPQFEALVKEVKEQMGYRPLSLGRRDKEKAEEARARFRDIPDHIRSRFGGIITSDEEGVDEFYGQFGDILDRVDKTHLTIFKRHMRLKVIEILMGQSDSALIARSGKLGYAWSYLNGVVDELDDFLKLMEEIRKKREQVKPELKLKEASLQAEKIMHDMLGKRLLLFWESPKVKQSEDSYLRIMTRLVDARREDILHIYVSQTARQMKKLATEARESIQAWIWHLTTGDDSSSLPGLWDSVRKGKEGLQAAHGYDTKADKVQMLVGEDRPEFEDAEREKALSRIKWELNYVGSPARLHINLMVDPESEMEGEARQILENPLFQSSPELKEDKAKKNYAKLMGLARRQFKGVVARTSVEEVIRERYPDPAQFVTDIAAASAEPLFEGFSGAASKKKTNLIRVQSDNPYFSGADGVEGELRNHNNLNRDTQDETYSIQVVGSENKYKMTFVRTDDLYSFEHFQAWHDCKDAYKNHVEQDERKGNYMEAELLHNFPAEAQAVKYERILSQKGESYEPLHPRVVMLLEDVRSMRQFFVLAMMGKIFENEDKNVYRWELEWETANGTESFWLTPGWNVEKDDKDKKPDIFSALHGYIVVGRTQEVGRSSYIDKDYAEQLLEDVPLEERKGMLDQNLAEDGLIGSLRAVAYDERVRNKIVRRDFYDLARVAEILIEARIQSIAEKKERKSTKRRGSSMFKVYDPDSNK
ncbi:MAG: hypothetical protein ACI85U_001686, partial [Candidatus Promineifilaceae bacterium]